MRWKQYIKPFIIMNLVYILLLRFSSFNQFSVVVYIMFVGTLTEIEGANMNSRDNVPAYSSGLKIMTKYFLLAGIYAVFRYMVSMIFGYYLPL